DALPVGGDGAQLCAAQVHLEVEGGAGDLVVVLGGHDVVVEHGGAHVAEGLVEATLEIPGVEAGGGEQLGHGGKARCRAGVVVEGDHGGGGAVVLVVLVVHGEEDFVIAFRWAVEHRAPGRVALVDVLEALAVEGVVVVAIALVVAVGEAGGQLVGDGQVEDALDVVEVVVAHLGLDPTFEFIGGFVGLDGQGATGGVAAEQGALGAAQDVLLANIEAAQVAADGAAEVDAVDVHAHGGVGYRVGAVLGLAANRGVDDAGGAGTTGAYGKAGRGALQ